MTLLGGQPDYTRRKCYQYGLEKKFICNNVPIIRRLLTSIEQVPVSSAISPMFQTFIMTDQSIHAVLHYIKRYNDAKSRIIALWLYSSVHQKILYAKYYDVTVIL